MILAGPGAERVVREMVGKGGHSAEFERQAMNVR